MAVRGLLFDVENPYEASTKTLAQAGQTMAAQTKASTVTTKEEGTVGDILDAGMTIATGISAFKGAANLKEAQDKLDALKEQRATAAKTAAEAAPQQFKEVGTQAQAQEQATMQKPKGVPISAAESVASLDEKIEKQKQFMRKNNLDENSQAMRYFARQLSR